MCEYFYNFSPKRQCFPASAYLLRSLNPFDQYIARGPTRFLPLLKKAFAGGLLRLDRLRLTLGVRDGALAAGKPGEARGGRSIFYLYGSNIELNSQAGFAQRSDRKDR